MTINRHDTLQNYAISVSPIEGFCSTSKSRLPVESEPINGQLTAFPMRHFSRSTQNENNSIKVCNSSLSPASRTLHESESRTWTRSSSYSPPPTPARIHDPPIHRPFQSPEATNDAISIIAAEEIKPSFQHRNSSFQNFVGFNKHRRKDKYNLTSPNKPSTLLECVAASLDTPSVTLTKILPRRTTYSDKLHPKSNSPTVRDISFATTAALAPHKRKHLSRNPHPTESRSGNNFDSRLQTTSTRQFLPEVTDSSFSPPVNGAPGHIISPNCTDILHPSYLERPETCLRRKTRRTPVLASSISGALNSIDPSKEKHSIKMLQFDSQSMLHPHAMNRLQKSKNLKSVYKEDISYRESNQLGIPSHFRKSDQDFTSRNSLSNNNCTSPDVLSDHHEFPKPKTLMRRINSSNQRLPTVKVCYSKNSSRSDNHHRHSQSKTNCQYSESR